MDTSLVAASRRQVLRVVLLQHRPAQQPDRVVLHRRDGRRRASCRSARSATAGSRSSRRTIPGAMVQYAEECRTLGIPFIFDPGQQCARMSGDELRDGITGAAIVIVNDYELELLRQKTGLSEEGHPGVARRRSSSRAASTDRRSSRATAASTFPRCTPHRIVDPTGVGDAYRGGLMKGHRARAAVRGRRAMGSVAATYALEHLGGQSHSYTWDEFTARYEEHFGALRGRCRPDRARPGRPCDRPGRDRPLIVLATVLSYAAGLGHRRPAAPADPQHARELSVHGPRAPARAIFVSPSRACCSGR